MLFMKHILTLHVIYRLNIHCQLQENLDELTELSYRIRITTQKSGCDN